MNKLSADCVATTESTRVYCPNAQEMCRTDCVAHKVIDNDEIGFLYTKCSLFNTRLSRYHEYTTEEQA